jgi:hypothetical protein
MKSSPQVPEILLSVLRIERFSVVTEPIGIIAIVAILSPTMAAFSILIPRKYGSISPVLPRGLKIGCLTKWLPCRTPVSLWEPPRKSESRGPIILDFLSRSTKPAGRRTYRSRKTMLTVSAQ